MSSIQERIAQFQEFLDKYYQDKIHTAVLKGDRSLVINFPDIIKFDPDLSEYILNQPEDALREIEVAIQQFDVAEGKNVKVRLEELPESFNVKIRDVRSEHI